MQVSTNCEVCCRFRKPKARPVVGFPLATEFNQVLAMDIKEISGKMVLHMVDHATRYSAASVLRSKHAVEIIRVVMQFWISYFGAPRMFLTDNGREFDNEEFREMAQVFNVLVKTTPAQVPGATASMKGTMLCLEIWCLKLLKKMVAVWKLHWAGL